MNNPTTSLSDPELLEALHRSHDRSNQTNIDFLIHLGEVDARQLYLAEACSSMFSYCTERLHMAEGVAARSIAVARAGRAFPVVFEMMRRHEVHATAVGMLAPHLTMDNHQTLLMRAKHQTKRAIEVIIAELRPRPDAPDLVRKLPAPRASLAAPGSAAPAPLPMAPAADPSRSRSGDAANRDCPPPATLASSASDCPQPIPTAPPPRPVLSLREAPAQVEPTSVGRYRISFTGDESFVDLLDEVGDLLAHQVPRKDLESVMRLALLGLRDELQRKKIGRTKRPAKVASDAVAAPVVAPATGSVPDTGTPPPAAATGNSIPPIPVSEPQALQPRPSRHVPNRIKREVWARDGGRCTFTSSGGQRCTETSMLELEHLKPFAIHHEHCAEDMCLRCRAHNQWGAVQVYGAEHMARFRRNR